MNRTALGTMALVVCIAFSGPALAKGASHGHADLTIKKQTDTASPKMMSSKPGNTFKPSKNRVDPYKNYNFR
jgi:hypothetical protein